MLFSKLLKAGAAASLVLTCAGVNAQSWTSNSTYGLYVNQLKGTKGNVAIGVAASSSYQGNRLTIKADSAKNGLRIYDYKGNTRLLQGSNGGLTVGAASSAPANGLYVAGASNLRSSLTVAGASTFSSATFNSNVTAKSGLIVSAGLAKFDGPVSMNSTMVTSGTATFNSGMTVVGASTLAGALKVTGASTLASLTASSLTSTGAATLKSSLNVTGATTLTGAATLKNTLNVTGNTTLNGITYAKGDIEATGRAILNGGAIVKGGIVASLTDHPGYPGSISIGGTEKATIKASEFCGYKPACPKDLYFDAKNYIFQNGNVGIGVENPTAKLHVDGKILCSGEIEVADLNSNSINVNSLNAKDIQMDMHGAADYVFDENYDLKSLSEVESYVNEHKHLPGMPSAAEMDANGVSVSKMSNLLLEKVEELTLHMIKLEKENAALKAKVESLSK
ncbi:MAG: hypothetical protein KIH03_03200 [Paludibacteraceae bacterium]|nr:hypothetical protein [Paludibacteraceae bacterium]